MTTRTTASPRFAAFALSLTMTLAIFAGVSGLFAPAPAGALYAQADTAPQSPRM